MKLSRLLTGFAALSLVAASLPATGATGAEGATGANGDCATGESPFGAATLSGKVVFDGKELPKAEALDMSSKPEHESHCMQATDRLSRRLVIDPGTKGIANVFIELRNRKDKTEWEPEGEFGPADQDHCRFEPHVIVVPVGKEIVFRNSDPFMHNVHFYCRKNDSLNFGVPEAGEKKITFKKDEVVQVKCDVHTWMESFVIATSNPRHALTAADGTFTINDVPPGEYELRIWHESLGTVKVKKFDVAEGDNTYELKSSDENWEK